jgi:hypothetical protein
MLYFWWNIWKEWNRRTFQNKTLQPKQVALLCKGDKIKCARHLALEVLFSGLSFMSAWELFAS